MRTRLSLFAVLLFAALSLNPAAAGAKPPLGQVAPIVDGLLAVGLADEIRNNCPSISARMLRAAGFMSDLQSKARSMGYSDAEIRAFRKDRTEKARMRARGNAYLKQNGVTKGVPETYCALGRAEIAKSSQIGALLRAK
jgi:hypothetical protein